MQSILRRTNKQVVKRNIVIEGVKPPSAILEEANAEILDKIKELEQEIWRDEGTYKAVAQAKHERKLKKGVSANTADTYKRIISSNQQNLSLDTKGFKSKIEKLEAKKKNYNDEIDAKIEKLEAAKKTYSESVDIDIQHLESRIEKLEAKSQMTIEYHEQLLLKCYEEQPLDISYPPSHYKKIDELKELKAECEARKTRILHMTIAELSEAVPDETPDEIKLKKIRMQARREAAEENAREAERLYRLECEEALRKRSERPDLEALELQQDEEERERQEWLKDLDPDTPLPPLQINL